MKQKQPEIPTSFKVIARTPARVVFEGECRAVNGENALGPFTILPGHQNFITNVTRLVTLYLPDKKEKPVDIPVQLGVIHVTNGDILLYVILTPDEKTD